MEEPRQRPSQEDAAVCRAILARGSKSFHAAFHLLPRRVRDPIAALYAFCRIADDAVDRAGANPAALDRLRERVDRLYAGRPVAHPVDRAFSTVVQAYGLPRLVVEALLEGFRWDLEGRRYETLSELRAYSVRVASTVGVMMTLILGERRGPTLARACDLGGGHAAHQHRARRGRGCASGANLSSAPDAARGRPRSRALGRAADVQPCARRGGGAGAPRGRRFVPPS
jgi:phytoene/squalene synthetase